MKPKTLERPTGKQLVQLGLSKGYAYELARGEKLPSLATALKIQEATGFPVAKWSLTNGRGE